VFKSFSAPAACTNDWSSRRAARSKGSAAAVVIAVSAFSSAIEPGAAASMFFNSAAVDSMMISAMRPSPKMMRLMAACCSRTGPAPARILDLFTEFRDRTNGLTWPAGASLVSALVYFGLDHIGAQEKDRLRLLILRGGPWSESERKEILDYCASDVAPLERLLAAMLPKIDLPRALLRGRYMPAAAAMEFNGTPIDVPALELLRKHWTDIQDALIADIDSAFGVYEGRTFKVDRFEKLLVRLGIPWARTENGRLDLSDDTFREAAKAWPIISPLRELRSAMSDLRLSDLAVGSDGRNRTILSAFRSRTGRNQPSNSRFIFGPSVWLRGLVKPPPGYGLAYVDWSVQEFAIAAKLSGDAAMLAAYESGDPYLAFGKQIGALPADANKVSHADARQLFKQCILGISYGMEAETLARRIGRPTIVARDLIRAHHEMYRTFWQWSDAAVDCAMLHGEIATVFGWHVRAESALATEFFDAGERRGAAAHRLLPGDRARY
jgi:DNA polymerase I